MGRPDDDQKPAPPEGTPADDGRAGRVVVDARGRNVWQWAKAALDSTSILLKRLENKDLAIEPTQKVPVMRGADPRASGKPPPAAKPPTRPANDRATKDAAKRPDPLRGKGRGDTGGGFDPYNSR